MIRPASALTAADTTTNVIETELAHQQELLTQTVARISGLEAEIAALRTGITPTSIGKPVTLTDAIVTVVRDADTAQRPVDVLAARGRLSRAGRGRYLAP
jgi:hypothetical protein